MGFLPAMLLASATTGLAVFVIMFVRIDGDAAAALKAKGSSRLYVAFLIGLISFCAAAFACSLFTELSK